MVKKKKSALADRRKAKGLTQEDVAKRLHIDVRTYQRMEASGKVRHCYKTDLEGILK